MNWVPFLPSLLISRVLRGPLKGSLPDQQTPEPNDSKFKIVETGNKKYLIKDSAGDYLDDRSSRPFWWRDRDSATEFASLRTAQKKVEWLIRHYTETEI